MTTRALCIHGHFYQPPREDPLTGQVPIEESAAPFHNWNERIHAECYRANAKLGNFGRISFNVGPTLFSWMQDFDPVTYQQIIDQDRSNVAQFGVGNAMAQAYNHVIMPLAPTHDKRTQVAWGIADFAKRFGRKPQGMWLPETAVDIETLSIMAEQGIEFTILAPWQADAENLDTSEPYRVKLPNGRSIVAFFYHQGLSGRVSFDPSLTSNADAFVLNDLPKQFHLEKETRNEPQLVLVATDGELYGHHQPFRDMFLAHLLKNAGPQQGIVSTYPARWMREHPPTRTINIRERTSWSCHHGIGRWMSDCGCTPVGSPWKANLRNALNSIATLIDHHYAKVMHEYKIDPWKIRDDYIHVILGDQNIHDLLGEASGKRLGPEHVERLQMLLEGQRERQRMFTSCGWFFEDFDRIEPKNNIAYTAQAVLLTDQAIDEVSLVDTAAHYLNNVVSPRTGVGAKQVFDEFMQRAEDEIPQRIF